MYHFRGSVKALFRRYPPLPKLTGTAFVFGAAPDPVVPEILLQNATIITVNGSQLYLEALGVAKPHITFMRPDMNAGDKSSVMKLKRLEGRKTGLLIMLGSKKDPGCDAQRTLLAKAEYQYDDLLIIDRYENMKTRARVLEPKRPFLLRHYLPHPSLGVQAILMTLAMGAKEVAVSGISFRSSGCSYSNLEYERVHVDGDHAIIRRIKDGGLPVVAVEEALAADTGLKRWQSG